MNGNERVLNILKAIVRNKRVANAYLFTGGTPAEREDLARTFAKMLVTSEADILVPEQEKPNLLSVSDVRREICDTASIKPYGDGKKVYLVPNAAEMNIQAENALLKTLEEPPAYVVILLLAPNEEAFLPTILSRCVKLALPESRNAVPETEEAQAAREGVLSLLAKTGDIRTEDVTALVTDLGKNRALSGVILDAIRSWFRDVLAVRAGGGLSLLENRAFAAAIKEAAGALTPEKVKKILEEADLAARRTEANVSYELNYEALFFDIARLYKEAPSREA